MTPGRRAAGRQTRPPREKSLAWPRRLVGNGVHQAMDHASSRLYRNDKPLREIIGDEIRSRIFDGRFQPGDRLVERDLAEMFSASRHPVREALRTLQREGLAESLPSRGLVVSTLDQRQVTDLFGIREALEVHAVREATVRIAQGTPHHLHDALADARTAIASGDVDAAHAANARFHDEIIALSGNVLLEGILEPLMGRLHWLFRQILDVEMVIDEHQRLCDAMVAGDPERAATLARAHVLTYRAHTLDYLFGEDSTRAQ
ncbi:MAG: GntR family transcriptional regulator [Mycolicibacterium mageritense]|nr:MAG: GntR family transcriptional regulator [Mycolicibacterium mageritense]